MLPPERQIFAAAAQINKTTTAIFPEKCQVKPLIPVIAALLSAQLPVPLPVRQYLVKITQPRSTLIIKKIRQMTPASQNQINKVVNSNEIDEGRVVFYQLELLLHVTTTNQNKEQEQLQYLQLVLLKQIAALTSPKLSLLQQVHMIQNYWVLKHCMIPMVMKTAG